MKHIIAFTCAAIAFAGCGGGDQAEFNEDAARDAAIDWNPGNQESVDQLTDGAREFCGDDEQIRSWIESSQEFASSEDLAVLLAACPDRIAEIARELALPVPD